MSKDFRISLFLFLCMVVVENRVQSAVIILTSDQQLEDLQDPNKKINLSLGFERRFGSLVEICQAAERQGDHTLVIAFDEFFRQYRQDSGSERKLTPDMDEYVQKIKKIGDFARRYHLGIGLSLLSPLELGPAFINRTGEAGRWLHYGVAVRDSHSGRFCLQLWRQLYWTNNKGKFAIKLKGVRAFAFKEKSIASARLRVVRPEEILEITSGIQVTEWPGDDESPDKKQTLSFPTHRVQISHEGDGQLKGYDRVFVCLEYESPEMDYFSPQALPFLQNLLKKYAEQRIDLVSLYSDEMHIQQDWHYFNHHDNGQFCLRYLTRNMAEIYARNFGGAYQDLDKYLLYFVYGPQSYSHSADGCLNSQYVMGDTPEDLARTILFRDRYYKLLNNHVVDLFKQAKAYAEDLFQRDLPTHAHASWAQSPTIDLWHTAGLALAPWQYEYTSNFVWSNTVHQAASACYDYWKWGEYLQPTGNDFCEGGWSDRDYYGAAMAASIGIVNKYTNAYAAFWGMPDKAGERKHAVNSAFGGSATESIRAITENTHRDVEVLILYPMSLVAAEERFGSWMTQYAYANYITTEKFMQSAEVMDDGRIKLAGRTFSTLVTLFEPVPPLELLARMEKLARGGGHVLWCGPPPMLSAQGQFCLEKWQDLFGVTFLPSLQMGEIAAGKEVRFVGPWQDLSCQIILTDFLVDRIYPVRVKDQATPVAYVQNRLVGVHRPLDKGTVSFCGFRPRDDQSASLGYESKTLFELLSAIGAYPASGRFPGVNDNTEYVSRTSDYLTTRFPNSATVIAAHYKSHVESWPGGFSRDPVVDEKVLRENPLPSDTLVLKNFPVNGHQINFSGRLICAFKLDSLNRLLAFEGHSCREVELDGRRWQFSDHPLNSIVWSPVFEPPALPDPPILQIRCQGSGRISIPWNDASAPIKLYMKPANAKTKARSIPFQYAEGRLQWQMTAELQNQWLYGCRGRK